MWTEMKLNHSNAHTSRVELAIIAAAMIAAGVLLAMIVSVLQGQVSKAAQREAMRHSLNAAAARCWQESPTAAAMRSCVADANRLAGNGADASYGMPVAQQPMPVDANMSLVSLRY